MKSLKIHRIPVVAFAVVLSFIPFSNAIQAAGVRKDPPKTLPRMEKRGSATQLIVDGQPFLVLGGELHNSSSSSMSYMQPIWKKLSTIHMNTVLAAVSWELTEPEEGKFDFSLVDGLIQDARKNNLRLSLLWFGSWKNGLSHYVPGWVKRDSKRFPRMRITGNKPVESLTPLSEETMLADAKAFAAFMKHVKEVDASQQTVIMIQVQNEVGLLGDSRDHSQLAEQAYSQEVPAVLMDHLQKNKTVLLPELRKLWEDNGAPARGSWQQVFGNSAGAEEAFMAWHYARFINKVAETGKAEYALPMFVNAWIVQPVDLKPGDYPSGGPQSHVHDIWRAGAPAIDLLCPDIYLPEFDEITALYTRSGNALFIPESKGDAQGAANAFYAIGQHKGIGYSPFGIESRIEDPVNGPIPQAYNVLGQLAPEILAAQAKDAIGGIWLNAAKARQKIDLGGYTLDVKLMQNRRTPDLVPGIGYGLVIASAPDEFVIAGQNIQFNFFDAKRGTDYVGIESIDEGTYVDGKWVAGRRLNGDDIMLNYNIAEEAAVQKTGSVVRLPGDGPRIYHVKLYRFE